MTDAVNRTASQSFTIRIDPELMLPSVSDSDATVGQSFSETLPSASGGRTPYSYSVSGLPAHGLSFNSSTRRISGTPSSVGTLSLTYSVTDAANRTKSRDFAITIAPPPPPPPSVPDFDATVGESFSETLPAASEALRRTATA